MAFPSFTPSTRSYDPGDYANTQFKANSGAEFRILYGSKRTGMKLQLQYQNLADSDAKLFLDHYEEMQGTFKQFPTSDSVTGAKKGMDKALSAEVGAIGSHWRYEKAPQLKSVYPGVSTVTINLLGCTNQ